MTIIIFGTGDRIALPKLTGGTGPLGSECLYTKPSYNRCYSKYGFNVPLNYEGIFLDQVMDERLLKGNDYVTPYGEGLTYFTVSHLGDVWSTIIPNTDTDRRLSASSICTDMGWWIIGSIKDNDFSTKLFGFLATNPSEEKIDQFVFKYNLGLGLEWLSISSIVETLNRDFPNG